MKAIICGAGIAGLSAALSLLRHGWSVVLVERAPRLRNGGYMLDYFGPGYDAAGRLGILPELARRAKDVTDLDWRDGDGRLRARMSYTTMQKALGGKLLPLLRGDVEQVLYDAVRDHADLRFGTRIDAFRNEAHGVAVTLSDGSMHEADLLVGADGIHSETRRMAFGPEAQFLRPLGYETAAYFFESPEVSEKLGRSFALASVPGRMAGFYRVDVTRIASFFAWASDADERGDDPRTVLQRRFGDLGWVVPQGLAAAPEPEAIYFDIVAQVEMPRWHTGRVVLIGDAAYAVSLVAGQGASLGVAGGALLGEVLDGATDVPAALAAMEEGLRGVVEDKQRGGRRTAKWFLPETKLRVNLRNMALNVMASPLFARLLSPLFALDAKGFAAK